MRKRNFYFFHDEKFYMYREDVSESDAVIIRIETLEKMKKAACTFVSTPTIGAVSGIETFSMGISAKMFKWNILDMLKEVEAKEDIKPFIGNLQEIRDYLIAMCPLGNKEAIDEMIEDIDYNADEMELKEKKRLFSFKKK